MIGTVLTELGPDDAVTKVHQSGHPNHAAAFAVQTAGRCGPTIRRESTTCHAGPSALTAGDSLPQRTGISISHPLSVELRAIKGPILDLLVTRRDALPPWPKLPTERVFYEMMPFGIRWGEFRALAGAAHLALGLPR